MASKIGTAAVLTLLLLATWLMAPASTSLTSPAAAQKKPKEAEKSPRAAQKGPKNAAKAPKAGTKAPKAAVNQTCCYTEKSKCDSSCGVVDAARKIACNQECEGRLRDCLGQGVFITRRGSQVICAKR